MRGVAGGIMGGISRCEYSSFEVWENERWPLVGLCLDSLL